ncbi:bifunctional folylpolyglutamate synthase/dihydrofolate synthase [Lacticaseibacillus daqingensis]|uniref:bifunctional folylpolyglutamate synthase/dihydrofolate synthase n=1 Tax=Lacticaseibacillus daqingensis TaxID=2486014 RepID=UPI000F77DC6F|nr:Mur ligase family protein [Lacticaseibacillus daqingensis]
MATYEQLRAAMDHEMRAADPARVSALKAALATLGHPDRAFRIIHLAGTNGKGSTGAFLAAALTHAGALVGHFASPPLGGELNQTKLAGRAIPAATYAQTLTAIQTQLGVTGAAFTTFEWDVLVSLQWYATQHADWVVLEAGLGGATDATNAIDAPALAIFTHIALDHTAILGPTVTAIARNKAAIIKPGTTVVIAPHQEPAARAVLAEAATVRGATAVRNAATITAAIQAATFAGTQLTLAGQPVTLRMLGGHQIDNARTAWVAAQVLVQWGALPDLTPLVHALATVQLPGRLQPLADPPHTFIDAGHNPDALAQVLATLRRLMVPDARLLVVAGFLADKDTTTLAHQLASADRVWVTTPTHPTRALSGAALQTLVPGSQLTPSVQAGLAAASARAKPTDVVLVTGSFYLIGGLLND